MQAFHAFELYGDRIALSLAEDQPSRIIQWLCPIGSQLIRLPLHVFLN